MQARIGIVGPGKVGTSLARLWSSAGYAVSAVYGRSPESARQLALQVSGEAVMTLPELVKAADLIVLSVPDDAITGVVAELAANSLPGKAVIHCSGAHGVDVLAMARTMGAQTGSLHPVYPFADSDSAFHGLPGSVFALEAETEPLRTWLLELVHAMNGQVIEVSAGGKALYHAALVMASNYGVTLYAVAQAMLEQVGASEAAARAALDTLMGATLKNIQQNGAAQALTGPLVRGDAGTIRAHQSALADLPEVWAAYRVLALLTRPLLVQRGVSADFLHELDTLLAQDV